MTNDNLRACPYCASLPHPPASCTLRHRQGYAIGCVADDCNVNPVMWVSGSREAAVQVWNAHCGNNYAPYWSGAPAVADALRGAVV